MDFLTEVDKLVQLIECPIFTCERPASGLRGLGGRWEGEQLLAATGEGARTVTPGMLLECQERKDGDDRAEEVHRAGTCASERGSCPCALRQGSTQASAEGKTHLKNSVTSAEGTGAVLSGGRWSSRPRAVPGHPSKHAALCCGSWKLGAPWAHPQVAPLCPGATPSSLCKAELAFARSCLIVTPGLNVQSGSWLG